MAVDDRDADPMHSAQTAESGDEGVIHRPSGEYVQSLARGFAVIRAFDADHAQLTLSEVARRAELTRATARRFLHTLVTLGYVRTDGRDFTLTPRVLQLGYSYLSGLPLTAVAEPHLKELSASLGESTSASVLDGRDIVYVARVSASRIMAVTINVGTRFPAHATSMGRVLLAHLSDEQLDDYLADVQFQKLTARTITEPDQLRAELQRVRAQGWAMVDQELEVGLRSIAAPITTRSGEVIAAMNVSMRVLLDDPNPDPSASVRPQLLATAARISEDLAASG